MAIGVVPRITNDCTAERAIFILLFSLQSSVLYTLFSTSL